MEFRNNDFPQQAYEEESKDFTFSLAERAGSLNEADNRKNKKRAYQHIELWKRMELIDCVNSKEETMKDCSKRLGINYCTAKHILKVYRKTGSYETDLMRKKKEKDEELKQRVLNDAQFADYAMQEYKPVAEKKAYLPSTPSSTKDVPCFASNECSPENTHHSVSDNICELDYEPRQVQSYQYNAVNSQMSPNFLFERNACMQQMENCAVERTNELTNL